MSDAPERIWADPPETFDGCDVWHSEPATNRTEYIRADQAQAELQDAVAELIDATDYARNRLEHIASASWHGDGRDLKRSIQGVFNEYDEAIRARTDTDAQAELEARDKRVRNEAAKAADKLGYHCIGCGHLCGDPDKDLRLLRKAGAKSCCPEREMEPLSAAILALMEDQSDE